MSKKTTSYSLDLLHQFHTSGAGYDIIRYISLPDLLGDDSDILLYFLGKNLARKFTLDSLNDVIYVFEKLGWGHLELIKEKKQTLTFHLMSDALVYRLKAPFDVDFKLESGFLAEAIKQTERKECECIEKINRRLHLVEFEVIFTT